MAMASAVRSSSPTFFFFFYGRRFFSSRYMLSKVPGRDYRHWLIVMDEDQLKLASKQKQPLLNRYIRTLAKVIGSKEEAKKRIYNAAFDKHFRFGCLIDKKTSLKLKDLYEVSEVFPDGYLDAENKDYGAELLVNGEIVESSMERQSRLEQLFQKCMDKTGIVIESDTKIVTEPETDSATESETNSVTEPETDSVTEPETDPVTEPNMQSVKKTRGNKRLPLKEIGCILYTLVDGHRYASKCFLEHPSPFSASYAMRSYANVSDHKTSPLPPLSMERVGKKDNMHTLMDSFRRWIAKFGRNYKDQSELEFRFKIYQQTVARVDFANAKLKGFSVCVNNFADISPQEFAKTFRGPPVVKRYGM